ncbi:MAG: hypothetical protein KDD67_07060 [Ignavibacteriae bacterium]|nr:hypothetical protein [Ignavibacteriota bacterium]MCB9215236.1 hypothetical protein [Ignavibacteria bacterium]
MLNRMSRFGGFLLILISGGMIAVTASAQPDSDSEKARTRLDRQISSLIRSIDDIIWSDIRIYKLESDFKNRLVTSMQSEDESDIERLKQIGDIIAPEPIPGFEQTALSIAASPAVGNSRLFRIQLAQRTGLDPDYDIDEAEADRAYSIASTIIQNRKNRPKNFYLVTSSDLEKPRLIALLGVDLESGRPSLTSFVKVGTQLHDYLTSSNTDSTMYGEMRDAVREKNTQMLSNQMFVLRDLANVLIVDRTNTRATRIDENEEGWVLKSVSMGRPVREEWKPADTSSDAGGGDDDPWNFDFSLDIGGTNQTVDVTAGAAVPGAIEFPNEIVVGTDVVVAYYNYEMDAKQVKQTKWGVELLNNFDELNYPSIWGGRMTLNAILRNVKIGAVLPSPRFGGESIGESGLFDKPQKVLGGYGITFGGDFTAPMLNNSGLFNFHASYTFGEASTEAMIPGVFDIGPTGDTGRRVNGDLAYLIRYAFQGFYSFGFYADNAANHLFRLKLGGAVYGVDTYERQQYFGPGENVDSIPTLREVGGETRGGVAGKIEYMKGGTDIPYGAGFQYFDGSVQGNVWLQFIVSRSLDLKFEGKYFTPLFRDPRPWESNSLVIPSVEVKYHFGTP